MGNLTSTFNEKKENVLEEYETVKGKIDDLAATVEETQEQVESAVNTVSSAVDAAGDALDTVNGLLGDESAGQEDEIVVDEEPVEETDAEPWRASDPDVDPSIEAGRNNYNYADPGPDGLNEAHLHADVKPWIELGNQGVDESTKEDRIAALAITEKGRQILDILGYEYDYTAE